MAFLRDPAAHVNGASARAGGASFMGILELKPGAAPMGLRIDNEGGHGPATMRR